MARWAADDAAKRCFGEDDGLAPARVRRQLESSLRRLGVERADMYLTHDWDPDVPVAEIVESASVRGRPRRAPEAP